MHKLSGANKRFGRCPIHGQGCEVEHDIRSSPVPRKTEKSKFFKAEYSPLYTENGDVLCFFEPSVEEDV